MFSSPSGLPREKIDGNNSLTGVAIVAWVAKMAGVAKWSELRKNTDDAEYLED
jgi:hypothetical protein